MGKIVWHKGPPPHVGWWNASAGRNPDVWRWWNGKHWSGLVRRSADWKKAGKVALGPNLFGRQESIEWNDYWPEGAAVPRINPDDSRRGPAFVNEVLLRVRNKPRDQRLAILATVKSEMA